MEIVKCLNIASVISVLILESSDYHFKQTVLQIERIQKIIKSKFKQLYTKDIENSFESLLTKIKKGNITKEERLAPVLSPFLIPDLQ